MFVVKVYMCIVVSMWICIMLTFVFACEFVVDDTCVHIYMEIHIHMCMYMRFALILVFVCMYAHIFGSTYKPTLNPISESMVSFMAVPTFVFNSISVSVSICTWLSIYLSI